ncbi:phage/plasmid replication protein, II/X family [Candidatus Fukatsuia endosymbiont of Tuberolachnus salignus]|uniref:phage/plasmid replication protein, II/X family n=1 Tax=Candidatus Fukatsuia endosymbiont of Tuberolachnus salignus TaxID=3077957 RepID=UPI00313C48C5
MIDLIKFSIPFKEEHLIITKSADEQGGIYIDLEAVAKKSGLILSARSVEFDIDGDLTVKGLNHPFDSLPTHYSGLAMKIYCGTCNRHPCVEIKASPAKLLQGHNVFGSTDLALCGMELLVNLAVSASKLYEMLNISATVIDRIDVTYSARIPTEKQAEQVISALRNVSNGQTKCTRAQEWETTCMWNEGSRHRILIAYLKHPELMRQCQLIKSAIARNPRNLSLRNQLQVMEDPKLQKFSKGLVRFEGRLKQRFINNFGMPLNFFQAVNYQLSYESDEKSLIADLWHASFKDVLSALEGKNMNIYSDDNIYEILKNRYFRITPKGNVTYAKAQRLFGFYRRLVNEGYDGVLQNMDRATFWRHVSDLLAVGFSKAQLQNLTADKNNIVPLMQIIQVDFSNQRPDWYVEPVSLFEKQMNTIKVA